MGLKWMCVWVLGAVSAAAQENTNSIAGTVVDAGGSVIPNATITVVGAGSVEAKTNASGDFALAGLAAEVYTLEFRSPGFVTRDIATIVVAGRENHWDGSC